MDVQGSLSEKVGWSNLTTPSINGQDSKMDSLAVPAQRLCQLHVMTSASIPSAEPIRRHHCHHILVVEVGLARLDTRSRLQRQVRESTLRVALLKVINPRQTSLDVKILHI